MTRREELTIEQKALSEKRTMLARQTAQWRAIFLNDARIFAENPTPDNKMNMDISAKQLKLNERWLSEARCRHIDHQIRYGILLD